VDGVIVEKAACTRKSLLAGLVIRALGNFGHDRDLGALFGPGALLRLARGLVRMPDVSFVSWKRIPGEKVTDEPVAPYAPDLAVEVFTPGNTRAEFERKRRDYFLAGTHLVWVIQPKTQTAQAYTAPDVVRRVPRNGTLDGADVLPGFR